MAFLKMDTYEGRVEREPIRIMCAKLSLRRAPRCLDGLVADANRTQVWKKIRANEGREGKTIICFQNDSPLPVAARPFELPDQPIKSEDRNNPQ